MITNKELDEIQARRDACTPGDWIVEPDGKIYQQATFVLQDVDSGQFRHVPIVERPEQDRIFNAHARKDVPRLIAEIRSLKQQNEKQQKVIAIVGYLKDWMQARPGREKEFEEYEDYLEEAWKAL